MTTASSPLLCHLIPTLYSPPTPQTLLDNFEHRVIDGSHKTKVPALDFCGEDVQDGGVGDTADLREDRRGGRVLV